MARRVQLLSYFIQVRRDQTHRGFDLSSWPTSEGICKLVEEWGHSITGRLTSGPQGNQFLTNCLLCRAGNKIYGRLSSGAHGLAAPGVNSSTGAVDYNRQQVHVEPVPLYVQIRALPGVNRAILILQKFGKRSVKGLFTDLFTDYIDQHHPNVITSVHPMAPKDYLYQMVRGGVREIRFIKRESRGDPTADRVQHGTYFPKKGEMETVYRAERGGIISSAQAALSRAFRQNANKAQMREILGVDYDELKVEVRIGNTTRVINMTRPSLAARIDVDADVQRGTDGHPTMASLHGAANDLVNDLIEDVGVAT